MPFTTQPNRDKMLHWLKTGELPAEIAPGDWCFVYYRDIMRKWHESRRWTTAHNIRIEVVKQLPILAMENEDKATALDLAWQVFFAKHVMTYEDEKEAENGPITGEE